MYKISDETRRRISEGSKRTNAVKWTPEARARHSVALKKAVLRYPDSYSKNNVCGRVKCITYNGVKWHSIKCGLADLQAALNELALLYPTEKYDAALDSEGNIQVRPNQGTPGTITFSNEFQTILDESSGTWILPMKFGVHRFPWLR